MLYYTLIQLDFCHRYAQQVDIYHIGLTNTGIGQPNFDKFIILM